MDNNLREEAYQEYQNIIRNDARDVQAEMHYDHPRD